MKNLHKTGQLYSAAAVGGEKKKQQQRESDTKVQEKEKQWGTFCPTAARLRRFQGMGHGMGRDTLAFFRSQAVERFRFI